MNIILLSGGSGKRLWPLSNEVRSKQFIKLFKRPDGEYESMVQRVFRQINETIPDAKITIATSKAQVSAIQNQLGEKVSVSVEPSRRDTFPAIALAAAYLHDELGISENGSVVVCPVDPYVDNSYFESLGKLNMIVENGSSDLALMGIRPTYPSEKYGYIIPEDDLDVSKVRAFKEKPDGKTAQQYIDQGALWNGGVFAFKIRYLLEKVEEIVGYTNYGRLYSNYDSLPKISFDYEVVEKEKSLQVFRFSGEWRDVGTWNTLTEVMDGPSLGETVIQEECENVHVINELDVPVIAMGLHDVVISASPQGILIADKTQSSYIKPLVDGIEQQVMFAEKSWGSYRVLDAEDGSLTIKVTLKPGHSMNYHCHQHRDEVWVVIAGRGRIMLDGMRRTVHSGDIVSMKAGCYHTILALTELKIIEVQVGEEINTDDKMMHLKVEL